LTPQKEFKVLNEVTHSEDYTDRSVIIRKVRCPDCGKAFSQKAICGFAVGMFTPYSCPACHHPVHHSEDLPDSDIVTEDKE